MSVEELLKPRFEVIADYPKSPYKVGKIKNASHPSMKRWLESYPHLFKKLEWWEKRTENEMPEYLKHSFRNENYTFHKILKWDMNYMFGFTNIEKRQVCDLRTWNNKCNYLPATEEEYLLSLQIRETNITVSKSINYTT